MIDHMRNIRGTIGLIKDVRHNAGQNLIRINNIRGTVEQPIDGLTGLSQGEFGFGR